MNSQPTVDAAGSELTQRGRSVQIEKLVKTYGDTNAVDGVDLDIHAGELLTLLGASGSGKTTLLSMIAGFTSPTSGTVTVAGTDITRTLRTNVTSAWSFSSTRCFRI